ncbi:MAG: hypothetical protein JSW52_01730 [Candidatus Coatesbacteria bacterium]|nr:MAG: hypothetical protein JSW52_01730 [Candidatus Coatesbacteria bacterium]
MSPTVTIEDDRYAEFEMLAELAGYASTDEFIVEVLKRRTRSVLETFGLYE